MEGALDLGDLYTKLKVDFSDVAKAEAAATKFSKEAIDGFNKTEAAGQKMKKVGAVMSGVSVGILGTGVAVTKMAGDFNKGIAEVNSLLPETERDFDGLKESVRGVAMIMGDDLADSAKAAYQAISAGIPKENLTDFLMVSSQAATAGVTNTEVAVDGLTTVTNAWGDSAGTTAQIADIMFTAVKNGKTTFEELSRSMFQAAGVAPELGVDFKEIAAAAATMTKQGVPTSVAMTQMRQAMVALMRPNSDMVAVMEAAGIESAKAAIEVHGLGGTYQMLRAAAEKSGLSIEGAVGSVEGLSAVLKITGKNAEIFNNDLAAMESAAGSMESAFEEIDKTEGFSDLIGQIKVLATILGDVITPVLRPVIAGMSSLVMAAGDLNPVFAQIVVIGGAIVAAIGPILLGVGALVTALAPAVASAGGLSAALGTVAAASGPVGIAIAAIVAGGILLWKNWDKVVSFFKTAVANMKAWFADWKENNSELISSISESWNTFVEAAKKLWTALSSSISEFVTSAIEYLNNLFEPIGGLQGLWELFGEVVGAVLEFWGNQLKLVLDIVAKVFESVTSYLNGDISAWEFWGEMLGHVFNFIKGVLKNFLDLVIDIFGQVWESVTSIDWWQIGKDIMIGLGNGLKDAAMYPLEVAAGVASDIANVVRDVLDINSPSRVFSMIGANAMAGLAAGIVVTSPGPVKAAEDVAYGITDPFKGLSTGSGSGGADSGKITVQIINKTGIPQEAEAKQVATTDGVNIQVITKAVSKSLAKDIKTGNGRVPKVLSQTYNLRRRGR